MRPGNEEGAYDMLVGRKEQRDESKEGGRRKQRKEKDLHRDRERERKEARATRAAAEQNPGDN